jgi:hypothetical protein
MAGKVGWNPPTKFGRGEGEKKPDRVRPNSVPPVSSMDQMIVNEQPLGGAQTEEHNRKGNV